jgi:Flp pilus assembly protein TadD
MAVLLVINGKYVQAESYVRKAISSKANQSYHYSLLGAILESQRKLADALEAYKEAQRLSPDEKSHEFNVQRLSQLLKKQT